MAGQILAGLLIVLAILGSAQTSENSTYYGIGSPYSSDLSFAFFREANDMTNVLNREYSNELCDSHLNKIFASIKNYDEWALRYPDTWGRMPMSLLWGHAISMGNHEVCVAAARQFSQVDTLKGQYCLARIPISGYMKKVQPTLPQETRYISYKKQTPEFFELGMCIPKSCSPAYANTILRKTLIKHLNATINETTPMVFDKWCRTDEAMSLRGIDIFAIVFFSVIVCCMICSSIYDMYMTKIGKKGSDIFMAFSVITNSRKIFRVVDNSKNPNTIECLNGIRTISMFWVIFGHGYMTIYDLPHINKNDFYTWTETAYSMLVQNGSLCVDTFFFMSGLLMLWGAFREMEKTKGKLNIGMMYFHRYIRLTPVLAVVILFIMSLYRYAGAGPMWFKLGTQDARCADTWWASLLYVQNYAFPYSICVSQSWYLAVDTQLYVISPLFLIPLWKWGKKAVWPICFVGLCFMAGTFATFIVNDFTLFRVQDDQVDLRQKLTYYPTHTRIATWLIGLVFGYFFFKYNKGRQIPLAKPYVLLGWFLAIATMLTDLWGPYWRILPQNPDAPLIEGAFFEPLSRTSWAMAIGWIVWACYNGHGGLINDFLSWGFFQVFARLSYCMYVIHRIVQHVNAGRLQTETHFSDYEAVQRWWHDFGITLTISIGATLAFESPILGIEKAIFGNGKPKKKPEPVVLTKEDLTEIKTDEPASN